ncbi:MAG: CapA family protein [Clostridia bacterium]|nr:CapA family protein [Clostridia bacterium]
MRRHFRKIISIAALLVCVMLLVSCSINQTAPAGGEVETTAEQTTEQRKEPTSVNILAVGDNLIHAVIYNQANRRSANGGYDFSYAYENIADTIAAADISIINQETIIDPTKAPATYPCFNSPVELGDEMVKIGFDVFNLANNHSLDKGQSGLREAIKYWDAKDVVHCGAYLDEEDYKTIPTNTVNDIKFAYVGLTEPTNGLSLPDGAETILMLGADEERIEARVKAAAEISDMVIVNIHWGVEYTHTPTDRQHELAQKLADWGADIIVGTHPHVIQPVEYVKATDGRDVLVIYSLGNFISAQDRGPRMLGGMMHITVTKDYETEKTTVTNAKFTGVVTHYDAGFSNVRVYNLSDYTAELANKHGVRSTTPSFSLEYLNSIVTDVIDEKFLGE